MPRQRIVGISAFHVGVAVGASAPVVNLVCDMKRTGPIEEEDGWEENSYSTFSSSPTTTAASEETARLTSRDL